MPLAAVLMLASSCHGAAAFDGMLHKGDVTVQLGPVPEGWTRVRVEGADLAYRDQGREGSAMVDFRCDQADDDAPLSVLTGHLIMGTTARETLSEETIPFDGREAQHTVMRAKLDGVPLQYDIYVMKKDGCVFDVVYLTPPALYAQSAEAFQRFARGLHASTPPVNVGGAHSGAAATSADP